MDLRCFKAFCFCLAAFIPNLSFGGSDFDVQELLRGWAHLNETMSHSSGVIDHQVFNTKVGETEPEFVRKIETRFSVNGPLRRRGVRLSELYAEVLNPRYSFVLQRKDTKDAFQMLIFQQASDDLWKAEAIEEAATAYNKDVTLPLTSPWGVFGFYDLSLILTLPETTVLSLERDAADDKLVLLKLKCLKKSKEWVNLEDVTARLDPSNSWAIMDSQILEKDKGFQLSDRTTYAPDPLPSSGIRRPVYYERKINKIPADEGSLETWTFKEFSLAAVPDDQFELPAFGLTEPPIVAKVDPNKVLDAGNWTVRRWFILGNVVIIILLFLVFGTRRKLEAKKTEGGDEPPKS